MCGISPIKNGLKYKIMISLASNSLNTIYHIFIHIYQHQCKKKCEGEISYGFLLSAVFVKLKLN